MPRLMSRHTLSHLSNASNRTGEGSAGDKSSGSKRGLRLLAWHAPGIATIYPNASAPLALRKPACGGHPPYPEAVSSPSCASTSSGHEWWQVNPVHRSTSCRAPTNDGFPGPTVQPMTESALQAGQGGVRKANLVWPRQAARSVRRYPLDAFFCSYVLFYRQLGVCKSPMVSCVTFSSTQRRDFTGPLM